jgi:hypothetical protein
MVPERSCGLINFDNRTPDVAWINGALGTTVARAWSEKAVPMHCCGNIESVFYRDFHVVAAAHSKHGAKDRRRVPVGQRRLSPDEFVPSRRGL